MRCPHCNNSISNSAKSCRVCQYTQINVIKEYFTDRANELVGLSSRDAVWPFICCSTFVEYIAKMSVDSTSVRQKMVRGVSKPADDGVYVTFINQYFPAKYKNFQYSNQMRMNEPWVGGSTNARSDKCLPYKMYKVLRCGLVHAFSLVDSDSPMTPPRSIFIEHKDESPSRHLDHKKDASHDAALFISEDFAQDILKVTNKLFNKAKNDIVLKKRIVEYYHDYPPVQALV